MEGYNAQGGSREGHDQVHDLDRQRELVEAWCRGYLAAAGEVEALLGGCRPECRPARWKRIVRWLAGPGGVND
jgi:hypothetical protein